MAVRQADAFNGVQFQFDDDRQPLAPEPGVVTMPTVARSNSRPMVYFIKPGSA